MDIRRYFAAVGSSKKSGGSQSSKEAKKRNVITDSDEEKPGAVVTKRKRIVDSDSDDDIFLVTPKKEEKKKDSSKVGKHKGQPKSESPNLKPSTASSFFGKTSSAAPEKTYAKKKKNVASCEDEFEKTLQQLDEQERHHHIPKPHSAADLKPKPNENSPPGKKPPKESPPKQKSSEPESKNKLASKLKKFECGKRVLEDSTSSSTSSKKELNELEHSDKKVKLESSEKKKATSKDSSNEKEVSSVNDKKIKSENRGTEKNARVVKSERESENVSTFSDKENRKTPKKEGKEVTVKEKQGTTADVKTPEKRTKKVAASDSTPQDEKKGTKEVAASDSTPQDEKKKNARASYINYLKRAGPANPGSKEIPEGKPDCLQGLVFVLSGVLDSLDREETTEVIKKYGGKVTSSLSRNTSYLVVGVEAGQAKLKKAEQLGTKQIDEDGLLELIRTLPGKENKQTTPKQGSAVTKLKKFEREKEKPQEILPVVTKTTSPGTPGSCGSVGSTSSPKKLSHSSQAGLSSQGSDSPSSTSSFSPKTQSISSQELNERSGETLMWVDKYRPASTKNIIGQQGGASNVKKLLNWLSNWQKHQLGDKKPPAPSPWMKDDTGASYKAALLSGPPGVGKTTTAHLVCKELGFDVIELNASDARSKKSLDHMVSELLNNKSLAGFATGEGGTSSKHALLMDEVDGMSGNEDRGGVQELIALIKKSRIPIITMCNDRNHPKIRSLANHCFDLRFYKPRIEQIRGPMMSVCYREGIKIKPEALDHIIIGSNHDIRQVLHHLSMWSASDKNLQADEVKKDAKKSEKDLKKGPWDVCRAVFTESEHKTMSIHDKSNLFFNDYSIAPLFVQENYLKVVPHCAKGDRHATLDQISKTAASLTDGDLVEKLIRKHSAWTLLPTQAMYSSVLPGEYMSGHLASQIEFPRWFGNNSRRNKFDRIMQELQMHMRLRISGSKCDVGLDYCGPLRDSVVKPLVKHGAEGVDEAVQAMNAYDLLREDLEALQELSSWPGTKNPMSAVESKVKAAFTRKFNKECHMTPFAAPAIKKKKRGRGEESYGDGEEEEEEEEEEDEDISTSSMIKVKTGGNKGPSTETSGKGKGVGKKGRSKK